MRNLTKALALVSILVGSGMTASSLYAQDDQKPSGSMMDHRMMGDKGKKDDDGMMKGGMGGMMKHMSRMMDRCDKMMSDADDDKDRHMKDHKDNSAEPEKKG